MSVIDSLRDNSRDVLALLGVALALLYISDVSIPTLPGFAPLVAIGVLVCSAGAWYAADQIEDLVPEETGTLILSLPAEGSEGFAIHELNDPAWDDLDVEGNGSLTEIPDSTEALYLAESYDPETNTARATWLAGATPAELRTYRSALPYVKTTLSKQSDLFWSLRGMFRELVRDVSQSIVREQIVASEETTLPHGGLIEERLSEVLDGYEDDLLDHEQEAAPWSEGEDRASVSISLDSDVEPDVEQEPDAEGDA
jgi:hypothetical protein